MFERKVAGGKRAWRLPVAEFKGPSVSGVLRNEDVRKNAHAQDRADKRLPHKVKHVLRQAGFID